MDLQLLEYSDTFLEKTETLFEKQKWTDTYKEWFLIDKLRLYSDYHKEHIYELLYKYPSLNGHFVNVRKIMSNRFEMIFPEYLQQSLDDLRKLALDYFIHKNNESRVKFISIATKTFYSDTVVSYFKLALDAHKVVADILLEHTNNQTLCLEACKYASNIQVRCGGDCIKNIEKIRNLKFVKSESNLTKISKLLIVDESKYLEFKSSLTYDVKNDCQNRELAKNCLKTVAAFLNSEGGTLLIGIDDDKRILGLNVEIQRYHGDSKDKFLLYWTDLLTQKIGKKHGANINYELENIDGAYVLHVECIKSSIPCFYDKNEFFVRYNPSTHKLNKDEAQEYIQAHFLA